MKVINCRCYECSNADIWSWKTCIKKCCKFLAQVFCASFSPEFLVNVSWALDRDRERESESDHRVVFVNDLRAIIHETCHSVQTRATITKLLYLHNTHIITYNGNIDVRPWTFTRGCHHRCVTACNVAVVSWTTAEELNTSSVWPAVRIDIAIACCICYKTLRLLHFNFNVWRLLYEHHIWLTAGAAR